MLFFVFVSLLTMLENIRGYINNINKGLRCHRGILMDFAICLKAYCGRIPSTSRQSLSGVSEEYYFHKQYAVD